MMFICSILSNLISIHSAGCQTPTFGPLPWLCEGHEHHGGHGCPEPG